MSTSTAPRGENHTHPCAGNGQSDPLDGHPPDAGAPRNSHRRYTLGGTELRVMRQHLFAARPYCPRAIFLPPRAWKINRFTSKQENHNECMGQTTF